MTKTRRDVHQEVTAAVIKQLETADPAAFVLPWTRAAGGGLPANARTGKRYNGINVIGLWCQALSAGYESQQWASYKQWQEIGAQVRKGERASIVVFYKTVDVHDPDSPRANDDGYRKVRFAKASAVFNAHQVDGFEAAEPDRPNLARRLDDAEAFVAGTGATIRHGGGRAYYSPADDYVQLPERDRFFATATLSATEAYYATALHELTHWTGHKSRLDRTFAGKLSKSIYAAEELVAELGAAMLCASLGISPEPRADHAQYLAGWLRALKDDDRAIFTAAARAQEAADYLHRLAERDHQAAA